MAARAEQVHDAILQVAPYLTEAVYAPAVARYIAAEARRQALDDYVADVCATRGAGKVPSRTWEQLASWVRLTSQLGDNLGLSPLGRAKLKSAVGQGAQAEAGLEKLIAQGREIVERRFPDGLPVMHNEQDEP
jgi:hypothetical protein